MSLIYQDCDWHHLLESFGSQVGSFKWGHWNPLELSGSRGIPFYAVFYSNPFEVYIIKVY